MADHDDYLSAFNEMAAPFHLEARWHPNTKWHRMLIVEAAGFAPPDPMPTGDSYDVLARFGIPALSDDNCDALVLDDWRAYLICPANFPGRWSADRASDDLGEIVGAIESNPNAMPTASYDGDDDG